MPTTAVVITFDDDYSCSAAVQENLNMDELQKMVGRNVEFDVSKSKIAKGKVVGLEGDLVQIKWSDVPLGLGQSSMMRIMDSNV
ncbi:MAG TPA: hypothetical protein VN739_07535 [Nitrososphaerales archaeon]|nr:hypothetical protein [Nitrososphaerales archaeon]